MTMRQVDDSLIFYKKLLDFCYLSLFISGSLHFLVRALFRYSKEIDKIDLLFISLLCFFIKNIIRFSFFSKVYVR